MPDSMFGRPSQHLLPSYPPASAGGSFVAPDPDTTPVQPAPVSFKDFRFNSIGKQPELLSRISLSQPDHTDYHSSTPSPPSTPPPAFTNDGALQSKSSSRPTLLQQLAGSDFSNSMAQDPRWNASTSQSNRSLASRIQMNGSPSNDVVNTAFSTASRFPLPASRVNSIRRATGDASLIPPVEVLQPPESSPTTPASLAPALESVDVDSFTSYAPLMDTMTTEPSGIPTPPISANITSGELLEPSTSVVVDDMTQDSKPSPSVAVAIDSVIARQERLQAISANLANLASPLPPSQSPSLDLSSLSRADGNITSQSQHSPTPIVLRHPYVANQSPVLMGLNVNDIQMNTNESSLALVHSTTTEHQARRKAVIEAVQNLNSTLNAVHRAQIDSENALAFQIRTFEEQRAAFEQTRRAEETTLHKEFQELQLKREELNAQGALLTLLEQESRNREVARKVMLAKRQTQEEEEKAAQVTRMREVQEQIAAAVTELKEIKALKEKSQLEQLESESVPGDSPIEPQDGMDEEEISVIKSRNDLLRAIKHLRRMHSDKVQKLEESNRTLRRLAEERKEREVEDAERRRIAEEERLRAHAEAERARQALDEKMHRFEAERSRQEAGNDCEQGQLLVGQQGRADVRAHGLRRTEASTDQTSHQSHPEEIPASQRQGVANVTRTCAATEATEANSLSSEVTTAMNMDEDGKVFAPHRTVPSPDIHTNLGGSQNATSQAKQKKAGLISGGVMLATAGHLPPKPSAKPPSLSTLDRVAENALNPARTSSAMTMSKEGGHRPSFPTRLTPDHKPAFPRTPKLRTFLDATVGGNEELYIGPITGVSSAQQNLNLRHLKRSRSRIDENDSGDRSVRTSVKNDENTASLKREALDDQSRDFVQTLLSNLPASLPPRPAMISSPGPQKCHAASADLISSYPPKSSELSTTRGEVEVTIDEQPHEAPCRGSSSSQAVNASFQLPVPTEPTNSLLLGPVYPEPQLPESRIDAGEKHTHNGAENCDTTSSEPASATLSHELDGEDLSRRNRRFPDEYRGPRNGIDSRRPEHLSSGPRVETVRDVPLTTGRKRRFEFNDNEYGHRARRQRDDAWIVQDHNHDRVDSYRPHRDRHFDSEPDDHDAAYRALASPGRVKSYPSDITRENNDNRINIPPFSETPTAPAPRRQLYRRPENDDTYQRYQPSAPGYSAIVDQHHTDEVRANRAYEPMMEERMDVQTDPSLLARMSNTQRFPFSTNLRGRGRGEPNRRRGDFGRGRGRSVARGEPALLERLTSGPPSLGDRLS